MQTAVETTEKQAQPETADRGPDVGRILDAVTMAVLAAVVAFTAGDVFGFFAVSDVGVLATVAIASILIVGSVTGLPDSEKRAWLLIGAGVAIEAVARLAESVVPPVATAAILSASFGAIVFGLVSLPHVNSTRFGGIRIALDSLAGTIAIGILVWEFSSDSTELSELFMAMLNVFLLGALLFAALRRSPYRLDRRLLTLSFAFVGWAVIDFFPDSGEAQALVLMSAAAVAVTSWFLRRPLARTEMAVLRPPIWQTLLPYLAIVPLAVVLYRELTGTEGLDLGVIPAGTVVVGLLLVARQAAALRERKELVELERDQLILSIAHELRTPLTAVAGFVDILSDPEIELPAQERGDMFAIVNDQTDHLTQLIGDMTSLIRDRLSSVPIIPERVEAKEIIAEAITSFFDVKSGPPPVKAQVAPFTEFVADRRRLRQIVIAMLSNAHRYGSGKILIIAKRGDNSRILEVHDNGPGIPPKHEQLMWERFERGANQLNANVPGSGLGLAIIKALMKAHKGEAGYRRSEKLGGACFWVQFPHG